MKRLYLLRHADTHPLQARQNDAQRGLTSQGAQDAQAMGQWLAARGEEIEHIYASNAQRTRETYVGLAEQLMVSVSFDESLYLASTGELLHAVQELPESQNSVLLLAHNPGLHQLALTFLTDTQLRKVTDLMLGLPTCGLVVMEFATQDWADLQPGTADLVLYRAQGETVEV